MGKLISVVLSCLRKGRDQVNNKKIWRKASSTPAGLSAIDVLVSETCCSAVTRISRFSPSRFGRGPWGGCSGTVSQRFSCRRCRTGRRWPCAAWRRRLCSDWPPGRILRRGLGKRSDPERKEFELSESGPARRRGDVPEALRSRRSWAGASRGPAGPRWSTRAGFRPRSDSREPRSAWTKTSACLCTCSSPYRPSLQSERAFRQVPIIFNTLNHYFTWPLSIG